MSNIYKVSISAVLIGADDPSTIPASDLLEYMQSNIGSICDVSSDLLVTATQVAGTEAMAQPSKKEAKAPSPPPPQIRKKGFRVRETVNGAIRWREVTSGGEVQADTPDKKVSSIRCRRVRKGTTDFEYRYSSHDYCTEGSRIGLGILEGGPKLANQTIWLTRDEAAEVYRNIQHRRDKRLRSSVKAAQRRAARSRVKRNSRDLSDPRFYADKIPWSTLVAEGYNPKEVYEEAMRLGEVKLARSARTRMKAERIAERS